LTPDEQEEKRIEINGFQQVVELFRAADQSFRSSLIKRIADKNPKLARSIIEELKRLN
jgi:flagellar motor switch protein FliG